MNLQNHHKTSQQMANSLGMGVGSEEGLQRSVDPTPPHPHLWAVRLGSHSEPRSSAFLLPLSDRVEVDAISKAKLSLVRRRQSNATQQAFTTEDSQALPATVVDLTARKHTYYPNYTSCLHQCLWGKWM